MPPKLMNGTKRRIAPNRLQELREQGKRTGGIYLTLEEVAKLMDKSVGWISLQENHKRALSDEDVEAYSKIYKVPPHRIFKGLTVKRPA